MGKIPHHSMEDITQDEKTEEDKGSGLEAATNQPVHQLGGGMKTEGKRE